MMHHVGDVEDDVDDEDLHLLPEIVYQVNGPAGVLVIINVEMQV